VVTTALEEVAAIVSRAVRTKGPRGDPVQVRDLRAYLFRAFLRHVNHLKRKEVLVVGLSETARKSEPPWADASRELSNKILLDEVLAQCDFIAQDMAWRRMQGFSWRKSARFTACQLMQLRRGSAMRCNRRANGSRSKIRKRTVAMHTEATDCVKNLR